MNKPRLCEILDVEVDEKFKTTSFEDSEHKIYLIDEDGDFYYQNSEGNFLLVNQCYLLCDLIQDPTQIVHIHNWNKKDIKDLKAIRNLCPETYKIKKVKHDGYSYLYLYYGDDYGDDFCYFQIKDGEDLIPSLRENEIIIVDEILNLKI